MSFLNESFKIIGVDVGGTKTAVLLGTDRGEILERYEFPTESERGYHHALDTIERLAKPVVKHARAIGVSIGGPLDCERGIIYSPANLQSWDNVHLKDELEKRLGITTYVEHDGNAGALAEWMFGAGRGTQHLVFLTLGTGLGAGLILNGRLYRGASDHAGEVGHVRMAEDGPVGCRKAGSWEGFCAGPGLAWHLSRQAPDRFPPETTTGREAVEAVLRGDPAGLLALEDHAKWLGRGLAMLVDILNPEIIVLGSLGVRLGNRVIEPALRTMKAEAMVGAAKVCRVVPAALGENIGDVASLCAAIVNLRPPQL